MNLELTDREVGLVWEALTELTAKYSEKNKVKTQEIVSIIGRMEKMCGDNTGA